MGFGKSTLYSILPPGTKYRELWLPELINNHATLPSSIAGGHPLTLTGARKGTTCDGVHFDGSATSNINCGAIHNAAAKCWISFRFKFDTDQVGAGAASQYLWGKKGVTQVFIDLMGGDGRLRFVNDMGGYDQVVLPQNSWYAGVWYHIIVSVSDVNGMRIRVDSGTAVTDPANLNSMPLAADFCFGNREDPGIQPGFEGVIADVFCEEGNDLTTDEETELYDGIPPSTVDNAYPLDEGRGVTAYDRGADVNNGTLDTDAEWAWGTVKQPVLSLDGINDRAVSSAGVDISGDLTWVWVAKIKATYDPLLFLHFAKFYINATNYILAYGRADYIRWYVMGGGTIAEINWNIILTIDSYKVLIGTKNGETIRFFADGSLVGSATGAGFVSGAAATAYIGSSEVPDGYDISKPLLVGLIDGAFSEKQAKTFSKTLNDILGLGLTI